MPRPNPPRKRPRKRPAATPGSVRADAALTKQTAQSTQPKQPQTKAVSTKTAPARGRAAAAVVVDPDQMWAKRSYAILVAVFGGLVLVLNLLQWGLAGSPKPDLLAELLYWYGNPITLVAAAIIAALIAKRLTQEQRSLRLMESLSLGVVAFFVATFASIALFFFIGATNSAPSSTNGSGSVATPCPSSGTCTTPTASASASASPAASSNSTLFSPPAPTPAASGSTTTTVGAGEIYGALGVADVATLVLSYYIYPPLYKRLRLRRPPPRAGGRGGKPAKDGKAGGDGAKRDGAQSDAPTKNRGRKASASDDAGGETSSTDDGGDGSPA